MHVPVECGGGLGKEKVRWEWWAKSLGCKYCTSLSYLGAQKAASRTAGGLRATLLQSFFPQRAALRPESCHILFISWGGPEDQVRGDT